MIAGDPLVVLIVSPIITMAFLKPAFRPARRGVGN
jgi:hypothetical protein